MVHLDETGTWPIDALDQEAVPIAAASTKIRAKLTGKIAAGGSR
jgi:hypothetical protein